MPDIKIKEKSKIPIKTLNRNNIYMKRMKENFIKKKENKIDESEEKTPTNYGINRITQETSILLDKEIYEFDKYGKRNFKETKQNIQNSIPKIKERIYNSNIRRKSIIENKNKIAYNNKGIKNYNYIERVIYKKQKEYQLKSKKKAYQISKTTVKNTIKGIKKAVRATIVAIKTILATTKALISAIIAGGWVAVIIIVVICLIAMICCSEYGIFFSNEADVGNTMSSVIREINTDFTNKITDIQRNNAHDEYTINSNRAEWKDILSIYTVLISNGNEITNVATLDDYKIEKLKNIFWDMNVIEYNVDETEKEIETIGEDGKTKIDKVKYKVLHISISSKPISEMILQYNLNNEQILQISRLQKEEYNAMWKNVVYGSSIGSTDIVNVASSQIGNIGGQPYWSWYGFNSRVEWCACFVSWCANECGYIDSGIIPKYAGCESEGVVWFKTCGLWQERGYEPKPGDIIFFDWADSNDGKADHTGIVEKVENGKVYTIEGNSGDTCCRRNYDINSSVILGYGTPMYQ